MNKKESKTISILKKLEKKYPAKRRIRNYDFMSGLMFELFCTHFPVMEAVKYVDSLMKKYVDWNEIRVTGLKQLKKDLNLSLIDLEFLSYIKMVLDNIYQAANTFAPEFFEEIEEEELLELLSETGIDTEVAARVLVTYLDKPVMPLPDEVLRVIKKLGIFPGKSSRKRVRMFFSGMANKEMIDIYKAFRLLLEHAQTICSSKNPECSKCFMSSGCKK
jgi:endonuclease III